MRAASFAAIGTTATVCVTEDDRLDAARAAVERQIATLDLACSRFRPDSELVAVNAAAGAPVRVGPVLEEALAAALRAAELTDGLVDPTVGRSLRLLGYDRDFAEVGARDGRRFRARIAATPGWRGIRLDRAAGTVRVPAGTELDLGATAKALGADRAAAAAHAAAGCGVLVSLGGDIAVAGAPVAEGWAVRLDGDHGAPLDGPGPVVVVREGGLATSSTTVRRWRAGDAELHHVVDPRTGRSADTPWRTVTVAAGSCVDANIATTAALVLGARAERWLAERGLAARLVRLDGRVAAVGGWPAEAA
jgi:thiamine biosynthesis lipoprotein